MRWTVLFVLLLLCGCFLAWTVVDGSEAAQQGDKSLTSMVDGLEEAEKAAAGKVKTEFQQTEQEQEDDDVSVGSRADSEEDSSSMAVDEALKKLSDAGRSGKKKRGGHHDHLHPKKWVKMNWSLAPLEDPFAATDLSDSDLDSGDAGVEDISTDLGKHGDKDDSTEEDLVVKDDSKEKDVGVKAAPGDAKVGDVDEEWNREAEGELESLRSLAKIPVESLPPPPPSLVDSAEEPEVVEESSVAKKQEKQEKKRIAEERRRKMKELKQKRLQHEVKRRRRASLEERKKLNDLRDSLRQKLHEQKLANERTIQDARLRMQAIVTAKRAEVQETSRLMDQQKELLTLTRALNKEFQSVASKYVALRSITPRCAKKAMQSYSKVVGMCPQLAEQVDCTSHQCWDRDLAFRNCQIRSLEVVLKGKLSACSMVAKDKYWGKRAGLHKRMANVLSKKSSLDQCISQGLAEMVNECTPMAETGSPLKWSNCMHRHRDAIQQKCSPREEEVKEASSQEDQEDDEDDEEEDEQEEDKKVQKLKDAHATGDEEEDGDDEDDDGDGDVDEKEDAYFLASSHMGEEEEEEDAADGDEEEVEEEF